MKQFYILMVVFYGLFNASAQIVNIPDANFKAALLAADTNNTIATNAISQNIRIDVNNDGEIELSEALTVGGLRLPYRGIADLTGITSFSNLGYLNVNNNQLTVLDISSLSQLSGIDCRHNSLTNLDVSGLSHLTKLDCAQNQLTTLNLNGVGTNAFNGFRELRCSFNALTSIDMTGLSNLWVFDCANNQLTSLDVSDSTVLYYIDCSNNQLATLDLSTCRSMWDVYCQNNPLLTYLNLKNSNSQSPINISQCPNLQYICADESDFYTIQNQIAANGYTNCNLNSYCSFTPGGIFYVLHGETTFDTDGNGCDPVDPTTGGLNFSISSPSNSGNFIADATGNYNIAVGAGTHMITPTLENPSYFTITPASLTVNFPIQQSPNLQEFCITANGTHPDLEITIVPLDAARPGFDSRYKIICKNKGTIAQSGSIHLNFNDAVLDFVSSNPSVTSQSPNVLVLDFDGLAPFQTAQFIVTFNANSPTEMPALNGGDVLNFAASIVSAASDETPDDNTFTLNQTVVNSFDPNDKTCLEGATITPEMVGKDVHYMIRFENTGTANAENIVVKDMIDATKFDVSSLIPLDGSHEFVTRINGNKVEFIFENINLPFDDANNDGYVAFKIKTKPTLVLGDTFSNTASIYFDYNFPIVTEPAVTAITALAKQDFAFDSYFRIYPNPASDVLKIGSKQNIAVQSISIYNTLGQLVLVVPNTKTTKAVDVSGLQTGNYFIKIHTDKGTSNARFIKN